LPQSHAQSPSRTSFGGAMRMPPSAGPAPAGEGPGASYDSGRPYPLLNCGSGSSGSVSPGPGGCAPGGAGRDPGPEPGGGPGGAGRDCGIEGG